VGQGNTKARASSETIVTETVEVGFPVAATMSNDAYWCQAYNKAAAAIQKQANELLLKGNLSWEETRDLVESQRNWKLFVWAT
jgi:hypothetical protein